MLTPIFSTNSGYKHGLSHTAEYRHWGAMRDRCYRKSNPDYPLYGGRGITVCDRWNDFTLFVADMGERPGQGYTIDRINPDKGYSPDNCVWATRREQGRNKRNTMQATMDGITKSLSEWCEEFNRDYNVVKTRVVRCGWDLRKALMTPSRYSYFEYLEMKKK